MDSKILLAAVLCSLVVGVYCQPKPATMQQRSGKVTDLNQLRINQKGKCCVPRSVLGDDTAIIRMDNSNGAYFVTNDPNCGNVIYSSSYPTTFSHIYLCGQCKGGCPKVDGGKTLVLQGQKCNKPDGSWDITKQCEEKAPVCGSGADGVCETLNSGGGSGGSSGCPGSGCNRVCPNQVNNAKPCSCGFTFCFGKCIPNASADAEWTKNGQTPPPCVGGTSSGGCPSSGCNRVCPGQVNNAQPCSCGYTFCFGKCVSNASADAEWTKAGKTPPPCKG